MYLTKKVKKLANQRKIEIKNNILIKKYLFYSKINQ